METIKLCGLEWMTENLTGHGGTEINGNWYYTLLQAGLAAMQIGYGWRLPTENDFKALCGLENSWDNERKGRWFGENKELFLPALGYHNLNKTATISVGFEGDYWGVSSDGRLEANTTFLHFKAIKAYSSSNVDYRLGFSVRLVRDIK